MTRSLLESVGVAAGEMVVLGEISAELEVMSGRLDGGGARGAEEGVVWGRLSKLSVYLNYLPRVVRLYRVQDIPAGEGVPAGEGSVVVKRYPKVSFIWRYGAAYTSPIRSG